MDEDLAAAKDLLTGLRMVCMLENLCRQIELDQQWEIKSAPKMGSLVQ